MTPHLDLHVNSVTKKGQIYVGKFTFVSLGMLSKGVQIHKG